MKEKSAVEIFINERTTKDMLAIYKKLNLDQKYVLFEILIVNDVSIINDIGIPCNIHNVAINAAKVELTIKKGV